MLSCTTALTAIPLTTAIVRHPLVVSPDTTVLQSDRPNQRRAIALQHR